jgi:hypothetical protein
MLKTFKSSIRESTKLVLIALVLANMVPIIGILFFDWDFLVVITIYWCENLIVGFFTICKFILAPRHQVSIRNKLLGIPLFSFLLGWFNAGYGVAIIFFFVIFPHATTHETEWLAPLPEGDFFRVSWPGPLSLFELGIDAGKLMFYFLPLRALIAIGFLTISHGVVFVYDYLIRGDRNKVNLSYLITEPWSRVLILHLAIIIGGFLCILLKPNVVIIVCIVLIKCCVDSSLYLRQYKKKKN